MPEPEIKRGRGRPKGSKDKTPRKQRSKFRKLNYPRRRKHPDDAHLSWAQKKKIAKMLTAREMELFYHLVLFAEADNQLGLHLFEVAKDVAVKMTLEEHR